MSDYNAIHTYQIHDYQEGNRLREKWHRKVERLKGQGLDSFVALHKAGHMPTAPLVTRVVPNPLSLELRIVLGYFWEIYGDNLYLASRYRQGLEGDCDPQAREEFAQRCEVEAANCLTHARNICFDLFSPASPHSHIHVHSEYGCNDDDCLAWASGFEAAKESVGDWYQPEPPYSV